MRIPFVIDNETHRLADILNDILQGHGRLMASLQDLPQPDGAIPRNGQDTARTLTRDDLHLVCFDYVWS